MPKIAINLSQPLFLLNTQNRGGLIDNKEEDDSEEEDTPILIDKTIKINIPDKFYGNRKKLKAFLV